MTLERRPFDEATEEPDTCPLCGGNWLDCGCDPKEADAAYIEGDAA